MDFEAIKTSADYQELEKQHSNGGYFSPFVIEHFNGIKDKTNEEKLEFYADEFNSAFGLAEALRENELFNKINNTLDLTSLGLGEIYINSFRYTRAELGQYPGFENVLGYRVLDVRPLAFAPRNTGPQFLPPDFIFKLKDKPEVLNRMSGNLFLVDNNTPYQEGDFKPEYLDLDIKRVLDAAETLIVAGEAVATPG